MEHNAVIASPSGASGEAIPNPITEIAHLHLCAGASVVGQMSEADFDLVIVAPSTALSTSLPV